MSETRERYVILCQQALVLAVVAAVAAPAAGVVTLDIVSPTRTDAGRAHGVVSAKGALVSSEPVAPVVKAVPLTLVTPAPTATNGSSSRTLGRQTEEPAAAGQEAVTAPQSVSGFATVGVTWAHGATVPEGSLTLSVRTQTDGTWTDWESLDFHDEHAPDPGTQDAANDRPGTEPYVVGDVDDVEVKAVTPEGTLPADLQLAVVDPGASVRPTMERPAIDTGELTPRAATTAATESEPTSDVPAAELSAAIAPPMPQIYSRAQWGADEKLRDGKPSYGTINGGFVHHTVNANDYTEAEVPAILRGIYAYHTQTRGWSDIGYNFLVDRFGRIWEGRYGGVDKPVIGAHTLNYNEYSFAMSAIGNYEIAEPSAAMIDAYGRLFAWKLSISGVDAASTAQKIGKGTFQAISGHRDAGKTACPGKYLYAKIPEIRALAAQYQRSFGARNLEGQISGTAWPDLVVRNQATQMMDVVRTAGQVSYGKGVKLDKGWATKDLIAYPGDVTGDGYADVIGRDQSTGITSVYPGSPTGKLGKAVRTTTRFRGLKVLVGVGDMNGDGRLDVAGRAKSGSPLLLFPGNGKGKFKAGVVLAKTWPYRLTSGSGDFNADGRNDMVAVDKAGQALLFRLTKKDKLRKGKVIGLGFKGVDLLAGGGDVTNDGLPDLVAHLRATKQTRVYSGDGHGGLAGFFGPYTRFKGVDWISAAGQFAGSSAGDIIGRAKNGVLRAYPNSGGHPLEQVVPTTVSLAGVNVLLNVGDWNKDGFGDVMTRNAAGEMHLLFGNGADGFNAPVLAASGWSTLSEITSVGDMTGDGNNDLMARLTPGAPFDFIAGNGSNGFGLVYDVPTVDTARQVAAGQYDAEAGLDTIVAHVDGSLWLYSSNGTTVRAGRQVGSGLTGFDWLVGLGDFDGDGRPDLIGRLASTGALYLLAGTGAGFDPPRFVADGFAGYDLAG